MNKKEKNMFKSNLTLGQYLADKLASGMGSWLFLIIQTCLLITWILINTLTTFQFDSYPFIFLNLVLSFQAAYAAPIIMMANNRKEEIDRDRSIAIYEIETQDHIKIADLFLHLNTHFHKLNTRIDTIESKLHD